MMTVRVTIQGKGTQVNLTKQQFLAKGGEGNIYAKGSLVYKICEPGKMIPDGKFQELSVLDHPNIVRPQDILLDSKNHPVGYTMQYIKNTLCLCQLFTKAFRTRTNITPDIMLDLVRQMQQTIQFIHSKKVLIVDLNELNFLVGNPDLKDIYFIDVNSYQTPHYPATVIMDSIRDRHCKNNHFTIDTDWFSFAIVSFQMFIGIHPFKGKHPSYTNPKTALDGRMLANISILNPQVSYPQAACQLLTVIPEVYRQWYQAVFEDGKRLPPPLDLYATVQIITPVMKKIGGSNNFTITEIYDFGEDILNLFQIAGKQIAICTNNVYINRHKIINFTPCPNTKVCLTPRNAHPIAVTLDNGMVKMMDLITQQNISINLAGDNLMVYDGRCYVLGGGKILEVKFIETANNILASADQVGNILEQGTQVFDGVILQNLFDAYYCSVFPNSGEHRQFAVRELDNYKIVDAKYERGLLQIVGVNNKTGKYDRFVIWFEKNWSKYDYLVISDVIFTALNFTVLDNGVCIQINEDENIEIFRVTNPTKKKEIDDPVIEADMKLASKGAQAIFTRGNKIYSITMTKP
jgi:serine/threonine protein kinase